MEAGENTEEGKRDVLVTTGLIIPSLVLVNRPSVNIGLSGVFSFTRLALNTRVSLLLRSRLSKERKREDSKGLIKLPSPIGVPLLVTSRLAEVILPNRVSMRLEAIDPLSLIAYALYDCLRGSPELLIEGGVEVPLLRVKKLVMSRGEPLFISWLAAKRTVPALLISMTSTSILPTGIEGKLTTGLGGKVTILVSSSPLPVNTLGLLVFRSAEKATVPLSLITGVSNLVKEPCVSAILVKVKAKASPVVSKLRERPTAVTIDKRLIAAMGIEPLRRY
jgi:hypothetical protein